MKRVLLAAALAVGFLAGCDRLGGGAPKPSFKAVDITGAEYARELSLPDADGKMRTLADFKGASGIDVNMTLFASNDELFAKLRAGNPGYDVIVPSNDFVERMASAGMMQRRPWRQASRKLGFSATVSLRAL